MRGRPPRSSSSVIAGRSSVFTRVAASERERGAGVLVDVEEGDQLEGALGIVLRLRPVADHLERGKRLAPHDLDEREPDGLAVRLVDDLGADELVRREEVEVEVRRACRGARSRGRWPRGCARPTTLGAAATQTASAPPTEYSSDVNTTPSEIDSMTTRSPPCGSSDSSASRCLETRGSSISSRSSSACRPPTYRAECGQNPGRNAFDRYQFRRSIRMSPGSQELPQLHHLVVGDESAVARTPPHARVADPRRHDRRDGVDALFAALDRVRKRVLQAVLRDALGQRIDDAGARRWRARSTAPTARRPGARPPRQQIGERVATGRERLEGHGVGQPRPDFVQHLRPDAAVGIGLVQLALRLGVPDERVHELHLAGTQLDGGGVRQHERLRTILRRCG